METTQEYYMLFWIEPRSSMPLNSRCTVTYFSSHKAAKQDKQDMLKK